MSDRKLPANNPATTDIQWHRFNDFARERGKASGIKIEYCMSDEIEFARMLAIKIRKKLMRQLFKKEDELFQEELNRMGLLHSHDTVCEELRMCNREQAKKKGKLKNINKTSSVSKLFKMLES